MSSAEYTVCSITKSTTTSYSIVVFEVMNLIPCISPPRIIPDLIFYCREAFRHVGTGSSAVYNAVWTLPIL